MQPETRQPRHPGTFAKLAAAAISASAVSFGLAALLLPTEAFIVLAAQGAAPDPANARSGWFTAATVLVAGPADLALLAVAAATVFRRKLATAPREAA